MKSKIVFIILFSSLILLTACDSNGEETFESAQENTLIASEIEIDDGSEDGTTQTTKETEPVVTEENIAESMTNSNELVFDKSAQIEETVIYDENDVKITATGLVYANNEVNLRLQIENNSNVSLSFISGSMGYSCNSVNGYMIDDGYLNCDVAAGKKANGVISFEYSELITYGITEIADIEIGIEITDDDYNRIYTGPRQIKTSIADTYEYNNLNFQNAITGEALKNKLRYNILYFNPDTVYEDLGISIVSECIIERNGKTLLLIEVVNNTEEDFFVETSDITVNGLMVENGTWSYDSINSGKTRIVQIDILNTVDELCQEAFNIKQIGNIELEVGFVDDDIQDIASPTKISIDIPNVDVSFDSTGKEVYNSNGLRIVSKGIFDDDSKYSDDKHIILLFENTSENDITVNDKYNSLSVNGFMTDYSFYSVRLEAGKNAVSDIRLWGFGLEKIPITDVSEITDVDFMISVRDDFGTIVDGDTVSITNN